MLPCEISPHLYMSKVWEQLNVHVPQADAQCNVLHPSWANQLPKPQMLSENQRAECFQANHHETAALYDNPIRWPFCQPIIQRTRTHPDTHTHTNAVSNKLEDGSLSSLACAMWCYLLITHYVNIMHIQCIHI